MKARRVVSAGALIATLTTGRTLIAQEVVTADDLKAPSSPAVAILGTAPTTVELPDSPRALVFNLASTVADSGGIPQNYAAQVAPYWLRSHPGLLFNSYVNPSMGQSIVRSFAVSVATADWKIGSGSNATDLGSRLALGVSAVILPGHVDRALSELAAELTQIDTDLEVAARQRDDDPRLQNLASQQRELADRIKNETDPTRLVELSRQLADTKTTSATITADLDAQIAKIERTAREKTLQIQTLNVQRVGAQAVIAGAWSWQIPNDVFGDTHGEKSALWVTPSYRMCVISCSKNDDPGKRNYFDALGVLRYLRDQTQSANGFDLGGRALWEITHTFAVSGEVVKRWWEEASVNQGSTRAVGVFEARLADKAYLFVSFGRGFTDVETNRTLVSLIGLNIGFGEKPVIPIAP